jgi:hypothetical protein
VHHDENIPEPRRLSSAGEVSLNPIRDIDPMMDIYPGMGCLPQYDISPSWDIDPNVDCRPQYGILTPVRDVSDLLSSHGVKVTLSQH